MKATGKMLAALMIASLLLNAYASLGGFTEVDEGNYTLSAMKLLRNLTRPLDNLGWLIMPERGSNGPVYFYVNAFSLAVFSHLLGLPLDAAAKIPSVVLTPLTLPLLYYVGMKLFDEKTGLMWALLYSVTPMTLYFGGSALMEPTLIFLLMLSLSALVKASEESRLYPVSGLLLGVALLTKLTVLYAIIPFTYLVYVRNKRHVKHFLAGLLLGVSPFIIDFMFLRGTFFMDVIMERQGGILCYFRGGEQLCTRLYLPIMLSWGLTPWLLALSLASMALLLKNPVKEHVFTLLWFIIPALHFLTLGDVGFRHIHPQTLPLTLAAAAFTSKMLGRKTVRAAVAVLVAATLAASVQDAVVNKVYPNTGVDLKVEGDSVYRGVASYVLNNTCSEDKIITNPPTSFYLFLRRPLILNWKMQFTQADPPAFTNWYMGEHRVTLDEQVKYWVMLEGAYDRVAEEHPGILGYFTLEETFQSGGQPVARILKYGGYNGSDCAPEGKVDLNLREAVALYRQHGERIVTN